MNELNLDQVLQVSGGSFQMTVVADVHGENAMYWVDNLATSIISEQIVGTAAFLAALTNMVNNYGANFDTVRIKSINFDSID